MSTQENKRMVLEAYQLFKAGDIPRLLERYHDDAEWIGPESDIVPFAGRFHGKAGIAQFFRTLGEATHATRFDIRECIAEGDKVVVVGEATWEIRATGVTYDTLWTHLLTMRDGKVAQFESIYDIKSVELAFSQGRSAQPEQGAPLHH
ncbi:MAG: nuclear transport factor 2 family protein [Telluria sp.]